MMSHLPSQDLLPAPIHSLPVELLSYIFTLSAHTSFIDDDVAEPSPTDFPFDPANMLTTLTISTVSRYWRNVALSTPTLWTDICISTELPDDDDEESRQLRNTMKPNANRIATYLARSGNAPIDILISARDPDWDFSETECVKFCKNSSVALFANLLPEFLRNLNPNTTTTTPRPHIYILSSPHTCTQH